MSYLTKIVGFALLTFLACASNAGDIQYRESTNPSNRACYAYIRTTAPTYNLYTRIDRSKPGERQNLVVRKTPKSYDDQSSTGIKYRTNFTVLSDQCPLIRNPNVEFIRISDRDYQDFWVAREDLILEDDLPKVENWQIRYLYEMDYMPGGNTELGRDRAAINASNEFLRYRVRPSREAVLLFTRDGQLVSYPSGTVQQLYRLNDTVLVGNATGLRNTRALYVGRFYDEPTTCWQDMNRWTCGLRPGYKFEKYHRVIYDEALDLPEVKDKILITRRPGPRENPDDYSVGTYIYANFEDPVRPVVFAKGVLFKDNARPSAGGKYRKSSFVQREVCVADCPEQLRLQGLLDNNAPATGTK